MTTKQTLGQSLRAARQQAGLPLREVERLTGISNAYLSQVECDKVKQPSPVWLHKLANVYAVSYASLLKLAGYPIPGERPSEPNFAGRIGPVTAEEEDALSEYLDFLRSRRGRGKVK
jgi:transcriptional regulator with XRE-family HTH domain